VNNRQLVEQYVRAHMEQDWASVAEMTAPDVVVSYPQSGETIRGSDNYVGMLSNYPGQLDDSELAVTRLHLPTESVHVRGRPCRTDVGYPGSAPMPASGSTPGPAPPLAA
jgi:hypothetical protein